VLASEGYPDTSAPNRPIYGIGDAEKAGVEVCHAATATAVAGGMSASDISAFAENKDGEESLVATGGRVLSVVATGKDFAGARAQAYAGIEKIQLQGSHYRKDIAKKVAQ
jgi:phosphoribosylamine--glycine ligase